MSIIGIRITDHCIVRYFERHYGIDIEEIKKEILPDHIREKIRPDEDSEYVIKNLEFRVTNNSVVTCVSTGPDDEAKRIKNKPKRHISNTRRKKHKDENMHIEEKYTKKNKKGGYR